MYIIQQDNGIGDETNLSVVDEAIASAAVSVVLSLLSLLSVLSLIFLDSTYKSKIDIVKTPIR